MNLDALKAVASILPGPVSALLEVAPKAIEMSEVSERSVIYLLYSC